MTYLAYGRAISCDLVLPIPETTLPPEIFITRSSGPINRSDVEWFGPGPQNWCWAGSLPGGFCLLFPDEAEFMVSSDGSHVRWFSHADPSPTLTHLLLDHVLPRALTRQGKAVLHGSGLVSPRYGCFVVVGDSGRGKSTLAAALVGLGYRFLADDCVVVTPDTAGSEVVPAYPELRLAKRSIELSGVDELVDGGQVSRNALKRRMALGGHESTEGESHRLAAVFALGIVDDRTVSEPLSPAKAALALLANSFHLNADGDRAQALGRFASLAESCPVFGLGYEHTMAGLDTALADIDASLARYTT